MKKIFQHRLTFPIAFGIALVAFLLSLIFPLATPNTVVVAFDALGGTPVEMVTLPGGGRLEVLPNTTRDGSTFNYWEKDGQEVTLQTVFTTNTTLRANFDELEYTVIYEVNGGDAIASDSVTYGSELRLPTPSKDRAEFLGWYADEALTVEVENIVTITQSVTFYARWLNQGEDVFSVSFFSEGLGLIDSFFVENGTTIDMITAPAREGYTFNYWLNGLTFEPVAGSQVEIRQDTIFFAKWTSNGALVTITFDTSGGSPLDPIQVPQGTPWSDPELTPVLGEGYQFLKWITDCSFDGFEVSCVNLDENFIIEEDLTAVAQYDYMIPLQSLRFETYFDDGYLIGYAITGVDDAFYPDEVISTLKLPERFSGLPVVSIGSEAFTNLDYIRRVYIPNSVQFIEYDAFANSSIEEVYLPESLEVIHGSAFYNTPLHYVDFPENSALREIRSNAFELTQLTSVVIPNSVRYLGSGAFRDSTLTTISFEEGSGLGFIGSEAFQRTFITSIDLPQGLKTISSFAFADTPMTDVYIPSTVTFLGSSAFYNTELTSIDYPLVNNQLVEIGEDVFNHDDLGYVPFITSQTTDGLVSVGPIAITYRKTGIGDVIIPEGIRALQDYFLPNELIGQLTLPSSLQFIGRNAFDSSTITNAVEIPAKVRMKYRAFYLTSFADDVTIHSPHFVDSEAFRGSGAKDVLFTSVPQWRGDEVLSDRIFRNAVIESITLEEGYTELEYGFTEQSQVNVLNLPNSINSLATLSIDSSTLTAINVAGDDLMTDVVYDSIGTNALNSPWGIALGDFVTVKTTLIRYRGSSNAIVVPDGIYVVGERAFQGYSNLASLDLNEVRYANSYLTGYNFTTITDPVMVDHLEFMSGDLFSSLSNLLLNGSVVLGDNIVYQSDYLVSRLPYLWNVEQSLSYDNEGYKHFGGILLDYDKTFDLTPGIITIPEGIQAIASGVFSEEAIDELTLPSTLVHIASTAFSHTIFPENYHLDLPQGLRRIASSAFANSSIESIRVPFTVSLLESNAFKSNALLDIEFEDVSQLREVYAPFGSSESGIKTQIPLIQEAFHQGHAVIDGLLAYTNRFGTHFDLPEGIVTIPENALSMYDYSPDFVESIRFPSTLKTITNDALTGLNGLSTLDFSLVESLDYIGREAFYGSIVSELIIEAPIDELHPEAFIGLGFLQTLEINLVNDVDYGLSIDFNPID